jgi:uncharacterized membrane protein YkvA (DUF1232 family)
VLEDLKRRASALKSDSYALYLVARHPRTPWYAKVLAAAVVAYALSPIDLIPDFIPVIGYLDDLVLVPAGIALAVRLVPPDVFAECRAKAAETVLIGRQGGIIVSVIIVCVWIVAAALFAVWVARSLGRR